MEYKWIFPQGSLECVINEDGLSDVIKTIHWRYKLTDGDYFAEYYTATTVSSPDAENFKPFDEITEADLISWISSVEDMEAIQLNLQANIELQKNPVMVNLNPPFSDL